MMKRSDRDRSANTRPAGKTSTDHLAPDSSQLIDIQQAILDHPEDASNWDWLGFTLLANRDLAGARDAYTQALHLDPGCVSARYGLGSALHKLGDEVAARAMWEEVVRFHPESEEAERALRKLGREHPRTEAAPVTVPTASIPEDVIEYHRELKHQRMEAFEIMARGICHEMNDPLTVLVGNIQFTLLQSELPPGTREHLERVQESAQALAAIVSRFANFARRRSDRADGSLDLSSIVDEVAHIVRGPFRSHGILLLTRIEAGLTMESGDARAVQLTLISLLTNSQEALPQGGRVTLRASRSRDRAHIVIEDSGQGLSEDERANLFLPFLTRKKRWRGLGLGLAEAFAVLQRHGGNIRYEPVPGKGARFVLDLPLKPGESRPCPAGPDIPDIVERIAPDPSPSLRRKRGVLLLVEDLGLRHLLTRFLEQHGSTVVSTGELACGMGLLSERHELIVCDCAHGSHEIEQIQREAADKAPGSRVLLILEDVVEPIDPAVRQLLKPFSLDCFARHLRELGLLDPEHD